MLEPCLSISASAQRLVEAVNKFIRTGERHSLALGDKDLIDEMAAACEMLTMASDNLFIQAQRYESKHTPGSKKNVLAQAAKDVLQGVLKVLLVKDDHHVRQLLGKTDSVLGLIRTIERVRDKSELISTFKAITFAVLALKMELSKRCQNLCSKSCRDEIMIWVSVLQNSIPSLSKASQTFLKYRTSVSAMASRDSVMQEISEACKKIKQRLQCGPQDKDDEDIISFVATVDKVLDNLSEVNRGTLHPDTETDVVFLVDHSMSVAHYAKGVYQELITSSCHRILQCNFRLLELNYVLKEKPTLVQMRSEYESVCETVLDVACEVEKHVNMALLQLIIETFLCPLEKMAQLKDVANHRSAGGHYVGGQDIAFEEFLEYTETLCQVSLLVSASSTDDHKVRELVAAVRCLESLDPEIGPAVLVLSKEPKNQAARKHLELLLGRWSQEVSTIMDSVDSLVDPKVFMDISEDVLAHEADVFQTLRGCPHSEIQKHFSRFVNLSERPGVLAKKLVDENSDPVYRNGLSYFITILFERITEAKNVYLEIMQTRHPPIQQYDTLERRMRLVLQAVRMLREGLDVKSHPHLLSAKRIMFRQRGVHPRKVSTVKKVPTVFVHSNKVKGIPTVSIPSNQVTENPAFSIHPNQVTENPAFSIHPNQVTENSAFSIHPNQVKEATADSVFSNKVIDMPTSLTHASQGQTLPEMPIKPPKSETETSVILPGIFQEMPIKPPKFEIETSVMLPGIFHEKTLEGGSTAEIYEVAKKLLIECAQANHKEVDSMTHNLLCWTNHIVENAEMLMAHCLQIPKVNELKDLLQKLDHLTPEISQKAKFMLAGDKQVGEELLKDALEWAKMANSARMIIDVTVDRWLVLTTDLRQTVEKHDEHQLKILMNAMSNAQKEMSELLVKGQCYIGKFIENGVHRAKMLAEVNSMIENLSLTITTSVDVATLSANKTSSDWWQLAMVCRDWSAAMACAVCEMDNISDRMELVGRERFCGLHVRAASRSSVMVNWVEEEMDCLLEKVDCVVVGDSTLKTRADELVDKLQSALSDLLAPAKLPINAGGSSFEDLFTRLKFRQATSMWIEKAVEVQDMIRNNCFEYLGFTHQILLRAQEVSLNEDLEDVVKTKERHELCSQFLGKSQLLKEQTLKAIHSDPDHTRRVVVRSTLDQMSRLTSQIEGLLRSSLKLSNADVSSLSEQWAARMKKLMFNLQRMDGINPSVVLEIEKMNKASFVLHQYQHPHHHKVLYPKQHVLRKQQHHALEEQPIPHLEQNEQVPLSYRLLGSHDQDHEESLCGQHQAQNLQPLPEKVYTTLAAPVQSTRNLLEFDVKVPAGNTSVDTNTPSHKSSSVQIVLSDAKYLSYRLKKWQEADTQFGSSKESKIIQSAIDMAHLCSEIALFTRGQGSLKNSEEVIEAALVIVRHSSRLEEFGQNLLNLASNSKCVDSLKACVSKMNTCASQLHVISSVLHNSEKSFQGDHILMRNAVNLLMAVRQMFSVAEGVAAKGVKEPAQSDEVIREVLSVLRKMQSENERYIRHEREAAQINDLGLRRMELHDPPTLTSLFDLKISV